jgi:DNA-directed RNA polymerase specialized sigma24 family protein
LYTYAVWALRDHDDAVDAVYCAFVIAVRNITQLRQPEHIQPWLYSILRQECSLRASASNGFGSIAPVSGRLRHLSTDASPTGVSPAALEVSLRRAELQMLEWPESEGLSAAHREVLELAIRHGLDSQGLGLVLGLGRGGDPAGGAADAGARGFRVLADAWGQLERSLAASAVARSSTEHCAALTELASAWSGRMNAQLTDHVDGCTRCQHHLHTVVGAPSAPTILPFVAAPHLLREILLDELRDPARASSVGADHAGIAARGGPFAPDGFPSAAVSTPIRRASRPERAGMQPNQYTDTEGASRGPDGREPLPTQPEAPFTTRWHSTSMPSDRVLTEPLSMGAQIRGGAPEIISVSSEHYPAAAPEAQVLPDTIVLPGARSEAAARAGFAGGAGSWPSREGSLGAMGSGAEWVRSATSTAQTAPMPRFAVPGEDEARAADRTVPAGRATHPVRQAVLSTVVLGAVGAVAATSAALLGFTPRHHSSQRADPAAPLGIVGSGSDPLTVSVSTPSGPAAPTHFRTGGSSGSEAPAAGVGSAAVGPPMPVSGSKPGHVTVSGGPQGAQSAMPTAFRVSVNQRDAGPSSARILLRNTGSAPIGWSATPNDPWVRLSRASGMLPGGAQDAIVAAVTDAAPPRLWTSKIVFLPGGAVVTLRGRSSSVPPSGIPTGASTAPAEPPSPTAGPAQPTDTGSAPAPTHSAAPPSAAPASSDDNDRPGAR